MEEGIDVVLFLCASGQQQQKNISFHLGAKENMKFIDCQSPFGIWMREIGGPASLFSTRF